MPSIASVSYLRFLYPKSPKTCVFIYTINPSERWETSSSMSMKLSRKCLLGWVIGFSLIFSLLIIFVVITDRCPYSFSGSLLQCFDRSPISHIAPKTFRRTLISKFSSFCLSSPQSDQVSLQYTKVGIIME